MGRWFAEFECDTHTGRIFWLPLFLDAPDERAASELCRRVETTLGERYSVTRSAGPRLAVAGQGSQLLAVYGATGRTARRYLLDSRSWELRAVPGRPPVDLAGALEMRPLASNARLEAMLGLPEPRLIPVRTVASELSASTGPMLVLALSRRVVAAG